MCIRKGKWTKEEVLEDARLKIKNYVESKKRENLKKILVLPEDDGSHSL